MFRPGATPPPTRTRFYQTSVIAAGGSALLFSCVGLIESSPRLDFYYLAALTLISGLVPIRIPKVSATLSISETFIFAGTLLYGPNAGTVLVFLDALLIWMRLARRRGATWRKMRFSLPASALSIWAAGHLLFLVVDSPPLAEAIVPPDIVSIVGGLFVFTAVYFLSNTGLVAVAIALEQHLPALRVWRSNFSGLWLNYLAGASLATLLVYNRNGITWTLLLVVVPVMAMLFFGYRWSTDRIAQAEGHLAEMERTFLQTIEALAMAIDAKDQVTHGHIRRVQRWTMRLADALGVSDQKERDALRAAALLHDTGKLAVPEYILNKPGRLTSAEFARMKLHASVGADILKSIDFPYPVEPIVRHHHENWDGTGYPAGLRQTEIPLGARILSVIDCYDAVTSDRPYRSRMSPEEAQQVLKDRRGYMYDPLVVDAFLRIVNEFQESDVDDDSAVAESLARATLPDVQLGPIVMTGIEDRQFRRLKEQLARVNALEEAAPIVFDYLEPVVPLATFVLYRRAPESIDLVSIAARGPAAHLAGNRPVPIGARITGWVFANLQPVLNSEAALELGPEALSLGVTHALVVPIADGDRAIGVLGVYAGQPFTEDHQRLVESAASLLAAQISDPR
jgi:putative nucleotidyltransferase with HDIG domain